MAIIPRYLYLTWANNVEARDMQVLYGEPLLLRKNQDILRGLKKSLLVLVCIP